MRRTPVNGHSLEGQSRRASITIDPARPADVDAVAAIEVTAFADPWTRQAFDAAVRERHARFRVARSAGKIVGYVIAWFVLDEGEIANLAVAPVARRRGVARALLDFVIGDARSAGIAQLFLEVRESNVAARALYATRGFKPVARRPRYYRKPIEDAIVLRLKLSS
jgi:[ribosomal protein S18]-alanine N-acetyltransferase